VAKPRDPFDLRLSAEQQQVLALHLCDQINDGLNARATNEVEVDYWHQLYEQARTRTGKAAPWPDAADLTSYLAAEKVDALHARSLRAIWTEPLWTVEGWGDSANKAPFVEEFHQWKAEEERLQGVLDRFILQALIEPRGLLEVSEGTELRTTRKTIKAKVTTDPMTGGIVYGENMEPLIETNEDGSFVEAGPEDVAAEQVIDDTARVRTGPVYRLLPYRDSLILPGHARDRDDIWGYAKRFWRPYSAVLERAKAGVYDAEAVEKMTGTQDRQVEPALQRSHMDVAPQEQGQAEKELWEILFLIDLNDLFEAKGVGKLQKGGGRRWYLATVHLPTHAMLRVQHDDLERSRFVPMILFPRIDRATEGFSLIGHKLITCIEEHTAWRNMAADRAAMVVQAPVKRVQGALWDPSEQPWGPRAVIDVRDPREVEAVQVPDYTAPVMQHIAMVERNAERIAGINDIASGQVSQESRTLGEVNMATEQSFVRMDLILRRAQESLEDLAQIRHAIWKRVIAERGEQGMDVPASLLSNLEGRGATIDGSLQDGKITADLLDGAFRFKPHGSVQTADPAKRRADWMTFVSQALPALMQMFPLPTINPQTANRAIWRETLRVFNVENQQAFIGSPAQDLQATMQAQMMPLLMQAMQGMAGPMGAPPMAGPQVPGLPPAGPPQAGPPMAGGPLPMDGGSQGAPPAA
jgi:hypothetical protein